MIHWGELGQIHVIRKLEEIINHWFAIDLIFLDQQGQVKNHRIAEVDQGMNRKDFKNSLSYLLLKNKNSREFFELKIKNIHQEILKKEGLQFTLEGPLSCESIFVSKIFVDHNYIGSVIAYCFLEKELLGAVQEHLKSELRSLDFNQNEIDHILSHFRILKESEKKYLSELVNLVSYEIDVFYTEILKREEKIVALNQALNIRCHYDLMIGKSALMQKLYSTLDRIQGSETTVLIQGENGTGKELIAHAIHHHSSRKNAAFVIVNCSAFNENLLDSELFGHVKGSFTGAIKDKKGLFEIANHGTLFLDEIGDMPLAMQVKLLRAIQEGTLTPVGGLEQKKVDVRIVAATNKDLKAMIEEGLFREDLYYRINVINLVIPALRDRRDDIPLLVDHFLSKLCTDKNIPLKKLNQMTMSKLLDYHWPGNIRELENEIERLVVLSGSDQLLPVELLSEQIRNESSDVISEALESPALDRMPSFSETLKSSLKRLEKQLILNGLERTHGNKSQLAKQLGISRASLIMKVEKYHLNSTRNLEDSGIEKKAGESKLPKVA